MYLLVFQRIVTKRFKKNVTPSVTLAIGLAYRDDYQQTLRILPSDIHPRYKSDEANEFKCVSPHFFDNHLFST